jgi:iron complex outermembrane recepter protein
MATGSKKRSALYFSVRWVATAATLLAVFTGLIATQGRAQEVKPDLSDLSLETLTSMEITSVARKEQKLTEAAAAIFVITSEDIRRSGLTSIPELLRTVPGLDVAEIDANKWAITTRGFNERYSDRTLFLMDGRALYSPLTSGVNWNSQETLLDNIERIEVIRGPGATLWGANAMDGVINIITKKAKATQGLLIESQTSIQDRTSFVGRYGKTIGSKGAYRIFGSFMDRPGSELSPGVAAPDSWNDVRGGFRTDWNFDSVAVLTLQGDLYLNHTGEETTGDVSLANPLGANFADRSKNSGGNVNAQWSKSGNHLDTQIRAYIDFANRNEVGTLGEFRKTFDLELNQHYRSDHRQDISWGTNFRYTIVDTVGSFSIAFNPANRALQLYGAYLQDEIAVVPNRLKLTVGSKLEHNVYTGYTLQPNARTMWILNDHVSAWVSISQAAASPSRIDTDVRLNEALTTSPNGDVTLLGHFGTSRLPSETVLAYEFGTRIAPHPTFSFDLATFYNRYRNFHTDEPGKPFTEAGSGTLPSHLVIPDYVSSNSSGMSRGAELIIEARPTTFWKLTASYTAMLINIDQSLASMDITSAGDSEGSTPRNQFQLHSLLNLPRKFEFDSAVYYVGKLADQRISPYTRLDFRAGWRPTTKLEISAGGRNLLQSHHAEFGSGELVQAQPVGRSAYLKATWSF